MKKISKPPVSLAEACSLFQDNIFSTTAYWFSFLSFGMCTASLGPTLLDLGCITKSTISQMSHILFIQALCSFLGSVIAGYISNRLDTDYIIMWSTTLCAVTLALVPFCHLRWHLIMVYGVMGLFMGQIDTAAHIHLLDTYGQKVAPILQALHFFYGCGAFLAPMLARPFLQKDTCTNTYGKHGSHGKYGMNMNNKWKSNFDETCISSAFWIYAGIQVPVILLMAFVVLKKKSSQTTSLKSLERKALMGEDPNKRSLESSSFQQNCSDSVDDGKESNQWLERNCVDKILMVVMATLITTLIFFADASKSAYEGYIYSYTQKTKHVQLSSAEGAYITATFWGFFALGRLLSIPVSAFVPSSIIMLFDLIGTVGAMTLLSLNPHRQRVIFICTAIYGFFLSSVMPAGVAMGEQYLSLPRSLSSILVIGAAAGEMLAPIILGHLFHEYGPQSLIQFELFNAAASLFILALLAGVAMYVIYRATGECFFPDDLCTMPCRDLKQQDEDAIQPPRPSKPILDEARPSLPDLVGSSDPYIPHAHANQLQSWSQSQTQNPNGSQSGYRTQTQSLNRSVSGYRSHSQSPSQSQISQSRTPTGTPSGTQSGTQSKTQSGTQTQNRSRFQSRTQSQSRSQSYMKSRFP